MKTYLQNIVKELKAYSQSLDKQSIIINKPWALIDSDLGIQKLIFKRNNELIMSKDGQVTEGKWEYFAEAKCLLIDRGTDKILCNETYIDDSILVLKVDGKNDNFIVLANENNIPNLDAYEYLKCLYEMKYGVLIAALNDDRNLFIKPEVGSSMVLGSSVKLENSITPDGEYISKDGKFKYVVKKNVIVSFIYIKVHSLNDGSQILIEQLNDYSINVGCKVLKDNQVITDDSFVINEYSIRIYVRNSVVVDITYLENYSLSNGTVITIEQKDRVDYKEGDKIFQNGDLLIDGKYKLVDYGSIVVKDGMIDKVGLKIEFIRVVIYVIIIFSIVILSLIL